MAMFSCFTATKNANALLIIFGEVSKNDANKSAKDCKFVFFQYAHYILFYEMQPAGQSTKFNVIKIQI